MPFNPPPGWQVPQGWNPPPNWAPDPSWPPAPPGWSFWIDAPIAGAGSQHTGQPGYPTSVNPTTAAPASKDGFAQAAISAAFIVPTPLFYYLGMAVARSSWQNWSVFLILFLFLAVAVVVRGRSWVRRGIAVTLVLTGLVVERGAAIVNVQVLSHFSEWLFGLSYLMSMAFFVGAWSVARRLSWASALGGVIGLVLACLALWLYHSTDYLGWFWVWIIDVGVFTVGCLSAWAVDALMPRSTPDQLPQNVGSQASW